MYLYKYRDLSNFESTAFDRLVQTLQSNMFWCAAPSSLNDPEEFIWDCDYTSTVNSGKLLEQLLISCGKSPEIARHYVEVAVNAGLFEQAARECVEQMIAICRSQFGLACFATSGDLDVMWTRYGGSGNGVCIEVSVPDDLLHVKVHQVSYSDTRTIHVDTLLAAFCDCSASAAIYDVALLTKSLIWASELEIRFLSERQNVSAQIPGAHITRVIIGPGVRKGLTAKLKSHLDVIRSRIEIVSRA